LAVSAAVMTVIFAAPGGAEAFDRDRGEGHWGWGHDRGLRRADDRGDPYGYQYQPRGYYPYYGSSYWRPLSEVRYRYRYHFELPRYYSAWGHPRPYPGDSDPAGREPFLPW
jgi:hypothetical protein